MAARSIGSLTVSFGLVAIPVKLYTATDGGRSVSFNLLHKGCGSRLKQQYLCARENIPVERDQMVKGYEFAKDQYVLFTPDEIKQLEEAGTQTADIAEFVPLETVDPVYFDKAYYLAPDKGGARPYALLAKALAETKRCAIGRWAARGRQFIVMIRPHDGALVMQQLLYAEQVRAISELDIPVMDVKDAELKLARQLIDQQTHFEFDARQYTDEVGARVEAAIQRKVEGEEITLAEEPQRAGGAAIIDIMAALRASLEQKGVRERPAARPAAKPAEAARPRDARKPPRRAPSAEAPAAARRRAKK
ncbi:MAG TPA: Ku protein [Xanthomonadales bacterium]|nr:Ku protein [Xanthomonadales bacterium]